MHYESTIVAIRSSCLCKIVPKKLIVIIYDLYPDVPIKLGYIKNKSKIAIVFKYLYRKMFEYCVKVVVLSKEMKEYLLKEKM